MDLAQFKNELDEMDAVFNICTQENDLGIRIWASAKGFSYFERQVFFDFQGFIRRFKDQIAEHEQLHLRAFQNEISQDRAQQNEVSEEYEIEKIWEVIRQLQQNVNEIRKKNE